MTPRERAIAAFNLKEPDDIVPTFELEFQLIWDLLGRRYVPQDKIDAASGSEKERLIKENAETYVAEAERLDYSLINMSRGPWRREDTIETIKYIKEISGDKYMVCIHADGTMAIPSGENMMGLVERMAYDTENFKTGLDQSITNTIEHAKYLADAGAEAVAMCADYCFNKGPFLSPAMFAEFVTPYLARQNEAFRKMGLYTIKHTDGNIMPIIDQLVDAGSHAIHSIDPQGGMDLAEVKRLYGDKVALCGNVHCAMLQQGTIEQVVEDSKRALRDGMPGGGFFFTTSNTPFIGMPLENYLAILDVRKEHGRYDALSRG